MEDLAHWLKNYMILSIFAYNNNNKGGGGGGGGKKKERRVIMTSFFVFVEHFASMIDKTRLCLW